MHLTLHITTACNMACDYCYSPPRDGNAMAPEVAARALELGTSLNGKSCGIVFFGGEPLLHKDLIASTVRRAREMEGEGTGRFHFKMTTNGLLLDEPFIAFSLRNDILIAMSFDGVREAHDAHRRLRNGKSSWDRLRGRLELLLEARPYSSILTVVNPDTTKYLSESAELLVNLGARYLIVSLNYAAPWTEKDFKVLKREMKKLARRYVEWTREGKKFYLSPFEVKLSSHINRHCYQKERCELARRQLSVDPEGYLYPCVQFPRAGKDSPWCIGNVWDGIDEERRVRIADRSEEEKEPCSECAIRERCHNTCGCLNWQTTGNINTISPVLCRYEQMMVPIADWVGKTLYKERNPLFLHKHYNEAYPVLSLIEDLAEDETASAPSPPEGEGWGEGETESSDS